MKILCVRWVPGLLIENKLCVHVCEPENIKRKYKAKEKGRRGVLMTHHNYR